MLKSAAIKRCNRGIIPVMCRRCGTEIKISKYIKNGLAHTFTAALTSDIGSITLKNNFCLCEFSGFYPYFHPIIILSISRKEFVSVLRKKLNCLLTLHLKVKYSAQQSTLPTSDVGSLKIENTKTWQILWSLGTSMLTDLRFCSHVQPLAVQLLKISRSGLVK